MVIHRDLYYTLKRLNFQMTLAVFAWIILAFYGPLSSHNFLAYFFTKVHRFRFSVVTPFFQSSSIPCLRWIVSRALNMIMA